MITTSGVLIFDYVAIGLFGVAFFAYLGVSFWFGTKGYERIASVGKWMFFLSLAAILACSIDAFDDGFVFTRPADGVTVMWFRQLVTTLIFPFAFLAFFAILHNPLFEEKHDERTGSKHYGNMHEIHVHSKWLIALVSFSSAMFQLISLFCGNVYLKWFTFGMFVLMGLLAFILVYVYIWTVGIMTMDKHHGRWVVKPGHEFWKGNYRLASSYSAWILLILCWITYLVIYSLGHAMSYYITYDYEALSYIVIDLVILIAGALMAYAAKHVQVKHMKNEVQRL